MVPKRELVATTLGRVFEYPMLDLNRLISLQMLWLSVALLQQILSRSHRYHLENLKRIAISGFYLLVQAGWRLFHFPLSPALRLPISSESQTICFLNSAIISYVSVIICLAMGVPRDVKLNFQSTFLYILPSNLAWGHYEPRCFGWIMSKLRIMRA